VERFCFEAFSLVSKRQENTNRKEKVKTVKGKKCDLGTESLVKKSHKLKQATTIKLKSESGF